MANKTSYIPGIKDDYIYCQNEEGKYSFENTEDEFNTGFLFDTFKVLSRNLILVGQNKDQEIKYGVISVCGNGFYLTCLFDKIKPYDDEYFIGKKDNKDYFINRYGAVFIPELVELRNKYK